MFIVLPFAKIGAFVISWHMWRGKTWTNRTKPGSFEDAWTSGWAVTRLGEESVISVTSTAIYFSTQSGAGWRGGWTLPIPGPYVTDDRCLLLSLEHSELHVSQMCELQVCHFVHLSTLFKSLFKNQGYCICYTQVNQGQGALRSKLMTFIFCLISENWKVRQKLRNTFFILRIFCFKLG